MKLSCDLCGGTLQMNMGGQHATCKECGLVYPMARLKEKLGLGKTVAPEVPAEPETPVVRPETPAEPVITPPQPPVIAEDPVIPQPAAPAEKQFIMQVDSVDGRTLSGRVQQGCIGIGESVYINGDYSSPCKVYCLSDHDAGMVRAKAGMQLEMYLDACPRNILKQARTVTGPQTPPENAYHYNGTVQEYFADLLRRKFDGYTLQTDVAWYSLQVPVNYLLLQNGQPKVAVFLFDSADAKSRYQAQKAVTVFSQAGIGCTHFYSDFRNDAQYVEDRIRSVMG